MIVRRLDEVIGTDRTVSGETCTVTESEGGAVHELRPGTVYALDQHDAHVLRAYTDMRMVCVFNPALAGPEVHDGTGAYPLIQ